MVCATVKKGVECIFMTKQGCQFNGGSCKPIVEQCNGCGKILETPQGKYCLCFPDPDSKWRRGTCNMATHIVKETNKQNNKLNPLKASKRAR